MNRSQSLVILGVVAFIFALMYANPVKAQVADESVFSAFKEVTSAQILASFTTEVELIAAKPGYTIIPVSVVSILDYGTATYSDASGTSQISYAGNATAIVSLSTLLAATVDTYRAEGPTGAALAVTVGTNKALVYKHTTANPTTGNGKLRFVILYRLIRIPSGQK